MIDLQQFCGVGDIRKYLNSPYYYKGWHIGCDGWMLVATRTELFDTPDTAGMPEALGNAVDRILAFQPKADKGIPASQIVLPQGLPCKACGAKGTRWRTDCPDCDGEGEISIGRHEYECKGCDGEGHSFSLVNLIGARAKELTCTECRGAGFGSCTDIVDIADASFSVTLIRRLMVLPDLTFFITADGNATLVFAGGVGRLMGVRK